MANKLFMLDIVGDTFFVGQRLDAGLVVGTRFLRNDSRVTIALFTIKKELQLLLTIREIRTANLRKLATGTMGWLTGICW